MTVKRLALSITVYLGGPLHRHRNEADGGGEHQTGE